MTAKQLTDSILQLAIQGKLVPQDPNDEPASILLERIREEKRKLVEEKVLKKKDLEETPIDEDETPFVLPANWEWTTISNIFIINPKVIAEDTQNAAFIPMEKIEAGYSSNYTFEVRKWGEIKKSFTNFADGDVAFAKITPCFQNRKSVIFQGLPNGIGAGTTELKVLRPIGNTIDRKYLLYFLKSQYFISEAKFKGTANQQRIVVGYLENKYFPLPPLAEQHRIVQRIEEILPFVKEYGEAYEEASKMDAELPDKLKKSILQEAIMGKLGTQNPDDEPASALLEQIREEKKRLVKEGILKKKDIERIIIDEENYPYSLPEKWEWVRLQDVTTYISRGKSPVYSETKKYPVVAQKCNQWAGFSLEKAKFIDPKTVEKYAEERILQDGDLLWNSTGLGTLGRMAIYDSSVNEYGWAVADSHVTVIRTRPDFAYYKYLYYYFASPEVQSVIEDKSDGSTKQKELAQETVKKYEIPLPPLAEQHRIVHRIEELYAEIDNMTKNSNKETDIEEKKE